MWLDHIEYFNEEETTDPIPKGTTVFLFLEEM